MKNTSLTKFDNLGVILLLENVLSLVVIGFCIRIAEVGDSIFCTTLYNSGRANVAVDFAIQE